MNFKALYLLCVMFVITADLRKYVYYILCKYGLPINIWGNENTYLCHLFQLCAYNMRSWGLVRSGRFAGSFVKTNPLVSRNENARDDLLYKDICCSRSDLCHLYYEVRPASDTCYSISPFILFGKTDLCQMSFCMLLILFNSSINTIVDFHVLCAIALIFTYIT